MTLPALPADWRIVTAELIADGIGGRVFLVQRENGSKAIVKQPSEAAIREGDSQRGADLLAWREGHGSVRLLGRHDDLFLLEYIPGRLLLEVQAGDDNGATAIAADVVASLHAGVPGRAPKSLEPLREHFRSLFTKAASDLREGKHSQFVKGAEVAERLLSNQSGVTPLHGDIHHENIMESGRGWVAIDPKGLIGDPAFDIANLFYNPVESAIRTDERRIASMASILSSRLGQPQDKLLDHAFAFSALSASWHAEDGNLDEAERSLAVGRAARAVRQVSA